MAVATDLDRSALQRELDRIGLDTTVVRDATGASLSTVQRWMSGLTRPSGGHEQRLVELIELHDRLAVTVGADYVQIWLRRPIERLQDRRPVDALREGDFATLAGLVRSLQEMLIS